MDCAKCSGSMTEKLVNGVAIDQCDNCESIWFDEGEMDWLIKIYRLAISDEFNKYHKVYDRKGGHCPRCKQNEHMVKLIREQRAFHIDMCPHCHGHWLEAGELQSLRDEHRYEQLRKSIRGEA